MGDIVLNMKNTMKIEIRLSMRSHSRGRTLVVDRVICGQGFSTEIFPVFICLTTSEALKGQISIATH